MMTLCVCSNMINDRKRRRAAARNAAQNAPIIEQPIEPLNLFINVAENAVAYAVGNAADNAEAA